MSAEYIMREEIDSDGVACYIKCGEIVRCGECRFTEHDGCDDPAIYCQKWDRWEMPKDFFCGYGKRKENGDATK